MDQSHTWKLRRLNASTSFKKKKKDYLSVQHSFGMSPEIIFMVELFLACCFKINFKTSVNGKENE